MSQAKSPPSEKGAPLARSPYKFRISQAILILREGKKHPLWREAAWHLMEHAGKDTQLLLEAQRDLLTTAFNEPKPLSQRIKLWAGVLTTTSIIVAALVWFAISSVQCP